MFMNKALIGGFGAYGYWTSSQLDSSLAWQQDFGDGSQNSISKTTGAHLRPVRAFAPSMPPRIAIIAAAPSSTSTPIVTFTITFWNRGLETAQAIVITDDLPPGAVFVSATMGGSFSTDKVTWNLGDLAPGASGTAAVTVTFSSVSTYPNKAVSVCRDTAGITHSSTSNETWTTYE
jgi:uncharacterized repeat protein (TIGR01451 family)